MSKNKMSKLICIILVLCVFTVSASGCKNSAANKITDKIITTTTSSSSKTKTTSASTTKASSGSSSVTTAAQTSSAASTTAKVYVTTTKKAVVTTTARTVTTTSAAATTEAVGTYLPGNTPQSRHTGFENEMLASVNSYRASYGLSALSLDNTLCENASVRAKEIVNYFSHARPSDPDNEQSCFTALTVTGITYAEENIAMYQGNVTEVMTAWMNSAGHRANILSNKISKAGFASWYFYDNGASGNTPGYYYSWSQFFTD
jgi:uncharacterized protein YkwD